MEFYKLLTQRVLIWALVLLLISYMTLSKGIFLNFSFLKMEEMALKIFLERIK